MQPSGSGMFGLFWQALVKLRLAESVLVFVWRANRELDREGPMFMLFTDCSGAGTSRCRSGEGPKSVCFRCGSSLPLLCKCQFTNAPFAVVDLTCSKSFRSRFCICNTFHRRISLTVLSFRGFGGRLQRPASHLVLSGCDLCVCVFFQVFWHFNPITRSQAVPKATAIVHGRRMGSQVFR